MAAADGAIEPVGGDDHLAAGLARGRAAGADHGDQDRCLAPGLEASERLDPAGHFATAGSGTGARAASIAIKIRSGVAGASKRGAAPGAAAATASLSA